MINVQHTLVNTQQFDFKHEHLAHNIVRKSKKNKFFLLAQELFPHRTEVLDQLSQYRARLTSGFSPKKKENKGQDHTRRKEEKKRTFRK